MWALFHKRQITSSQIILGGFALVILLGALVLMLPVSSRNGMSTPFLNCLFTSTSAVCMTVKKELTAQAPDSLIKVHLHPADTAEDVYRKFNQKVEEAKNEMETTADSTVAAFMAIPRLVLKTAVWLLKCLDYFGLVPRFLLEISPFHGSVYFTNVGSLGIKPVFHHLYDFGAVPAFCAFGRKRRAEEIKDGQIVERKYLDLTFNLDERICDGFYYASVIKYFLRLLSRPDVLDEMPETIEQDIP